MNAGLSVEKNFIFLHFFPVKKMKLNISKNPFFKFVLSKIIKFSGNGTDSIASGV
jgi:hypothetical protein